MRETVTLKIMFIYVIPILCHVPVICYGYQENNVGVVVLHKDDISASRPYLLYEAEPNAPIVSVDGGVSKECMNDLKNFSNSVSNFMGCALLNSRPLRYCEKCVHEYGDIQTTYKKIFPDKDAGGKSTCKEQILRADSIQLVLKTYNYVESTWTESWCDRCFLVTMVNGTNHYTFTKEASKLIRMINETLECFQDFTNRTGNNSVCIICQGLYSKANNLYQEMETKQVLCSDLIDSMNYTRLDWGGKYNCTLFKPGKGEIWIITAFALAMPLMFYFSVWVYGNRRENRHNRSILVNPQF